MKKETIITKLFCPLYICVHAIYECLCLPRAPARNKTTAPGPADVV